MLELHGAYTSEALVGLLGELLAQPPEDAFAAELVAVPTRGIERWITQRLAATLGARPGHGDGVCANVRFPTPGRLLGDALAIASGVPLEDDPWREERLAWALLRTIDGSLGEPWLGALARHFVAHPERRLTRAQKLARLFTAYGNYRPALIESWAQGHDQRWQAELWRRLRDTIGTPSPAERLPAACERLAAEPALLELPSRVHLFGLTRLPAAQLRLLEAIAAGRDVHLLLPRASIEAGQHNPLLISWGREHRELWQQLEATGARRADRIESPPIVATLLATIQRDIHADTEPPGPPLPGHQDARMQLDPCDLSLRVHSCHGRARQVEVLREAILHRLQADPSLEPRDVIVMCPDVETFAPLIEATFGSVADSDDGTRTLRVRIADRGLRQTNPVLSVVSRLLELPSGRVTASEVLDLADTEPVRRRFRFDDDELAQIREWVAEAGVHWGVDAQSRTPYRLEQVDAGTWAAGLRRLLLGVALDGEGSELYHGVLPAGAAGSGAIDLLGRFTEYVERLAAGLQSLSGSMHVLGWAQALSAAADALTAVSDRDAWQRRELDAILTEVSDSSPSGGDFAQIGVVDLRALLRRRLAGRPTRANFRTGHLTVCTLNPMRSVPHRVVCLLGLDDGVFPRHAPHDGDNLLLEDRQPGDRDPRAEDRQLLLDALLAARETLIITYSGHDERTNAPRPPAVPVGELLDVIDATARARDGGRARDLVCLSHPLQPFDPRNFSAGEGPSPAGDGPWAFDRAALEGALAVVAPRHRAAPFLGGPLPAHDDGGVVTLDELVTFVQRPARAFLRQRLGISMFVADDELSDSLPTELDALQRWGVGQRLLEGVLAGSDIRSVTLAEIARGTLPPGALGEPVIREVAPGAQLIARHALAYAGGWQARTLETNLMLEGGTRITGTASGVRGNTLLAVSYSRLNPRHRLAAWVRLLALSAAHPELPLEAVTVARAPGGRAEGPAVLVARVPQLGADPATRERVARTELDRLVELRSRGLREPLPLPCLAGAAYAGAVLQSGGDPVAAAVKAWSSSFDFEGEEGEPEHRLVFAAGLDLDALAPLALDLWRPLLAREVVERV